MRDEVIKVSGMNCGHCQAAVENAIKSLPGISQVNVRLEDKEARVSFDEDKVSLQDIKASIEEAGYMVDN